ncbi:uncharacterized protein EI97DRAFT_440607 [Westerdykella ornata]|uniref:Uncharacterized protein n=1 Tax=Westerdykella ornata TaxID=318751 RepID=A0A6A6JSB4_WESOR|nr:uncharacterized protein EI97DRAFT_440607 [Westerdykella ornata]KAF2279145.1 hypothetical protein EI97DRAFT_440607 [Westerdykella ornata]
MTVNRRDDRGRAGPYREHERRGRSSVFHYAYKHRGDNNRQQSDVRREERRDGVRAMRSARNLVSYADLSEQDRADKDSIEEGVTEEGELSDTSNSSGNSRSSCSPSPSQSYRRYSSPPASELSYLDRVFEGEHFHDRLSPCLWDEQVVEDRRRHYHEHAGDDSAYHFDLRLPHVKAIMRYMHNRYDTVTAYSMGMIEHGQIVFYMEAFPLGLGQGDTAANVFGGKSTAKAMYKHRYGIVVGKHAQCLKVVQMYTFQGRGLAAKSEKCRREYVGLRKDKCDDSVHASPHQKLDVDFCVSCLLDQTSVHLVTDKIHLSNHIMIAGRITMESLTRLRRLVRKVEESGWD